MFDEDDIKLPELDSVEQAKEELVELLMDMNYQAMTGGYVPYEVEDILGVSSEFTIRNNFPEIGYRLDFLRTNQVRENEIWEIVDMALNATHYFDPPQQYLNNEFEDDFETDEEEDKEYDIERIPIRFVASSRPQKCMCSICFTEATNSRNEKSQKNMTYAYPCGHCFHKECITNWIRKKEIATCPNCRKNIMQLTVMYRSAESLRRAKRPRFVKKLSI